MVRTRVGYAGGTKKAPTYRSLGDHTEAIEIQYDPKRIAYRELLKVFWDSHNPTAKAWSTQYKAVLWTHDEAQRREAEASIAALTRTLGRAPTTELAAAPRFWIAEDYHQKYSLRKHPALIEAVLGRDASPETIRDSTVAARLNGWVAGRGTKEEIAAEVEALEISEDGRKALGRALGRRSPASCAAD